MEQNIQRPRQFNKFNVDHYVLLLKIVPTRSKKNLFLQRKEQKYIYNFWLKYARVSDVFGTKQRLLNGKNIYTF